MTDSQYWRVGHTEKVILLHAIYTALWSGFYKDYDFDGINFDKENVVKLK